MKTVPLGQAAAQRVLARLAAAIPATVDAVAAADARVDSTLTGDIRGVYVQEEALRSALRALSADQQAAFLASIPTSQVSVDSRYGGWDNASGSIVPFRPLG